MSAVIDRRVFTDGSYADIFRPDTTRDPFHALYRRKRDDVLACLGELPAGSRILDLGGGMGRLAVPLASRYQVTLCDISERMLEMAGEAARTSKVRQANLVLRRVDAGQPLPFASHSFDGAVALDLLVHLADPARALAELRRIVRPAGPLLVDMTNNNPLWTVRYPRYVGRRPGRWVRTLRGGGVLPEWQTIVRHHSRQEFERMLDGAGLITSRRWTYGPAVAPKWFLNRCSADREINAEPV